MNAFTIPKKLLNASKENLSASLPQVSESMDIKNGKKVKCCEQLTQKERARCVVEQHKISLDPNLQVFTVMGTSKPHAVTLHPKESCSCPSTSSCCHILAAKLSIGDNIDDAPKKILNLTQLRKNLRSHKENKLIYSNI